MVDAKGIIHELNQPTWKTEVKPKRTNRDVFINKLSNRQLARLIDCFTDWHEDAGCKEFCPLYNKFNCNSEFCVDKIEKWLGEKA